MKFKLKKGIIFRIVLKVLILMNLIMRKLPSGRLRNHSIRKFIKTLKRVIKNLLIKNFQLSSIALDKFKVFSIVSGKEYLNLLLNQYSLVLKLNHIMLYKALFKIATSYQLCLL